VNFEIEYTDEFADWWSELSDAAQDEVASVVTVLGELGPHLKFPRSSRINGSRHSHMRELRIQYAGDPYRVLYAFDPKRVALLLIGGNKTGDDDWYNTHIPIADRLYDQHLKELEAEEELKKGEHDD